MGEKPGQTEDEGPGEGSAALGLSAARLSGRVHADTDHVSSRDDLRARRPWRARAMKGDTAFGNDERARQRGSRI